MKHFSVSAPGSATPAGAIERIDDQAMTQEGFKRFQRRKPRVAAPDRGAVATPLDTQIKDPQPSQDEPPMTLSQDDRVYMATQEEGASSSLTEAGVVGDGPVEYGADGDGPIAERPSRNPDLARVHRKPIAETHLEGRPGMADLSMHQPHTEPQRPLHPRLRPDADLELQPEPRVELPQRFDAWEILPQVPFDFCGQKSSRLPLVSAFRSSPTARAFDLLRTRLLHSLKAHGWKRVAVTSPMAGGGTTFCAVNLALSLARVPGNRTLLMDLNLRSPGVAAALGIAPHGDMAEFLAGEVALGDHLQRLSDTLAVGGNAVANADAAEILHDPRCETVIDAVIENTAADTVIFDLPPVLEHDDVAAFLPQVDGVLVVSDGEATTAAELAACEKMLAGQAPLLGVVLNRATRKD